MILDNEIVQQGDKVYDIFYKEGIVTLVRQGEIDVRFVTSTGNTKHMTYLGNGVYAGNKRLFWKDPIIVYPPKNDDKWVYIKNAVVKILQIIKSVQ